MIGEADLDPRVYGLKDNASFQVIVLVSSLKPSFQMARWRRDELVSQKISNRNRALEEVARIHETCPCLAAYVHCPCLGMRHEQC